MRPRPNILLITTDQHNPRVLGCAGDRVVRTPHLDRLAAEGLVSDRAYTPQPPCSPARTSIFTGQHVLRHGALRNQSVSLAQGVPTVTRHLQRHGYHTALIGKRHVGAADEADMGLDHQAIANGKFNFNRKGTIDHYHQWLLDRGHDFHAAHTWMRPDLEPDYTTYHGAVRHPLDEDCHIDAWIGSQAEQHLAGLGDQPWFTWVSFCSPHHPYDPPARLDALYDPAAIVLPRRSPRQLRDMPLDHLVRIEHFRDFRPPLNWGPSRDRPFPRQRVAEALRDPRILPDPEALAAMLPETVERQMIARYYATVTLVDEWIGRILDGLAERGQDRDTIVVFTADHGDHLGEHYLYHKGHGSYDSLVRVPMIIRHPEAQGGRRCQGLVSLLDLPATFLAAAGAEPLPVCDGQDLAPLLRGEADGAHEHLYIHPGCYVAGEWKYVDNGPDRPELYHLGDDPGELVNRAADPACRTVLQRMMRHSVQEYQRLKEAVT